MRIIVGLGNPGDAYAGSRHNVGFAVVALLAVRYQLSFGPVREGIRMAQGRFGGKPVMLVEPQMYMNRTGTALAGIPDTVAPALIVVHDDLDLEVGCVRVKRGGGTAGHRGLESIVERYGPDFTRVRVGIGRPTGGEDPAEYVLSRFSVDENDVMRAAVRRAAEAVDCIVLDGEQTAMNHFNVRVRSAATASTPSGRM